MTLKKNSTFKVGDTVRYYPVIGGKESTVRVVTDVYPNGIPSCREPMVNLEGMAGVLLASHCFLMEWMPSVGLEGSEQEQLGDEPSSV